MSDANPEKPDVYLERYNHVLEHARHLENRTFAALANYLTANAFMLTAWATFYSRSGGSNSRGQGICWLEVVLALIAFVGYLGGCAWALLGARNWEYARRHTAELIRAGSLIADSGPRSNFYLILRRVELDIHAAWSRRFSISAYPVLFSYTPAAVSLIYLALFGLLSCGRAESICTPQYWFLPIVLMAIGIVVVALIIDWCRKRSAEAENQVRDAAELEIGKKSLPHGRSA